MAVETMSQQEIQGFGKKLEAFGNSLPEKEQKLFAEILLRAASVDNDVEGHAFSLGTNWTELRHRLSDVLVQIVEGMGTMAPYSLNDLER